MAKAACPHWGLSVGLSVNIHSNLVKQQLHLVVSGKQDGTGQVLLTGIMGKTLQHISQGSNTVPIDRSSLPAGLYIIKYSGNIPIAITKVTKD